MSATESLTRAVLADTVRERLLGAILEGRYPPGSRIVETRAAREFGTSQTPVREALRDLEALGLVEISAFRGARVRSPSRTELVEGIVVRAELEALVVRPLVDRLTSADFERLGEYLGAMRRAAADGDIRADTAADAAFHGLLVERSGNTTLARVWRVLEPHSRTYITLAAPGTNRHDIAELHAPILEALQRGDAEGTHAALRAHFQAAEVMVASWPDEPAPDDGPGAPP